jgi:hypothetical protein
VPWQVTGLFVQRQSRVWRIVIATKVMPNHGVWQQFGGEIPRMLLICHKEKTQLGGGWSMELPPFNRTQGYCD